MTVTKTIELEAPVTRVWAFLTDPEKLGSWLMASDFRPYKGSQFRFTAEPSGAWDGIIHCEVREVREFERLSYTWNANDIGVETIVTFQLEPVRAGTLLTLTHSELENAAGGALGRHSAGWTNALEGLRNVTDGEPEDYDWSVIELSFFVEAPKADVFNLWSTGNGMNRFWADQVSVQDEHGAEKPGDTVYANGDKITLQFPTGTDSHLEILNLQQHEFILFSFGDDYGWIRVTLSEVDGRTRIDLKHFGLADDDESKWLINANARGWWVSNLMNIKLCLLHDRDLRVRSPSVSGALAPSYSPDGTIQSHDWTSFDIWLQIEAPPEEVICAWQTPAGLEQFFIESVTVKDATGNTRQPGDSIQCGDQYAWRWIHNHTGTGNFTAASEDSVSFTFGKTYQVTVSTKKSGEGCLLHLHQSGMQGSQEENVVGSLNCRTCWIYFLLTQKCLLEFGVDLRDKDPKTADAISVNYR
jgi:uncharacterized protein YndB with AHSA1/START domain